MLQALTNNFNTIFSKLRSKGILTEEHINSTMRDLRIALLDADVALPVVKEFIEKVSARTKGQEIIKSLTPSQMIIKIMHDELVQILSSDKSTELKLDKHLTTNIMLVGLQGSGKTSTSAKIASYLKNKGKKILLVSLDTYRPAAQEQLRLLAQTIDVHFLPEANNKGNTVYEIAKNANEQAKSKMYDIVIYDTAGRLHIDNKMMEEVNNLKRLLAPTEILFVADVLTGQDAVTVAKEFDQALDITGTILTKTDANAKGGAALSIKYITGKPIKFLANSEKVSGLETFDPVRFSSRILDMGDVLSLVEKASAIVAQDEAEIMAKRFAKGKFDLNDYLTQIEHLNKMGGLASIASFIPGVSRLLNQSSPEQIDNGIINKQRSIILSMTKKERKNPELLNGSRKKRIASGSGTSVPEINILLKQFRQISDMMKQANANPKSFLRNAMDLFRSR